MEKKWINISRKRDLEGIERAEKVERKRVNVVLDDDIHREAVKLAEKLRMDFSALVNVLLEAALSAEEQDKIVSSMYATILRRRGYIVTWHADQSKGEQWHREQAKKKSRPLELEQAKKRKK